MLQAVGVSHAGGGHGEITTRPQIAHISPTGRWEVFDARSLPIQLGAMSIVAAGAAL